MSSFDTTRAIEREAIKTLEPVLRKFCVQGQLVFIDHERHRIELQKYGDAIGTHRGSRKSVTFEFKAEKRNAYGNLFLETWSNRRTFRPGWLVTSEADYLAYQFLEESQLFLIDLPKLKRWAFGEGEQQGQLWAYTERLQSKYEQHNDTWGRPVPISVLRKGVGFIDEINLSKPEAEVQAGLFGM